MLSLPRPRGPLSQTILRALTLPPDEGAAPLDAADLSRLPTGDAIFADEDVQLALFLAYEPHYRALPGVDELWEWSPALLRVRRALEDALEAAMLGAVPLPAPPAASEMDVALRGLASGDGPSVSRWVERKATRDQVAELVVLRAPHQLREADAHTFAIPRLTGRAKAALVEIQADEYGNGRPDRIHAELFAKTLTGMGLDAEYGAYVEHVPALALAQSNVMSLFGLHRRLRGACVGHLALYESTSSLANRRYAAALRRVGWDDEDVLDFFEEHVEADAVHESIALVDMAGGLAAAEPGLAAQIVWGAAASAHVDGLLGQLMLERWQAGESTLREPLVVPV